MKIYKPPVVIELEQFYGELLFPFNTYPKVIDHLAALSKRLYQGIQIKHDPLYVELNNYHKGFIGKSVDELKSMDISVDDCYDVIAQEHSFKNWEELSQHTELEYDFTFELAVNLLLEGNLQGLISILQENPELVNQRSSYGHNATLLHYVGSNGVEFWRQKVPLNLAELTKVILDAGADKNATMKVYNGHFTTIELLTTSAHPYEAGLVKELKLILES